MYDYYLGGQDNYAADREAAEKSLAIAPELRLLARENRAFLQRAVRHLVNAGIRQFLDLGAGLPTQRNVHQVAHAPPDVAVHAIRAACTARSTVAISTASPSRSPWCVASRSCTA
ncbi:MAG: SAM-dependent methyltransferase [Actinomadura rubrobrunea]|nr:SAM-dependent methyltransferase [Actinomadura rubrobrunea]